MNKLERMIALVATVSIVSGAITYEYYTLIRDTTESFAMHYAGSSLTDNYRASQ